MADLSSTDARQSLTLGPVLPYAMGRYTLCEGLGAGGGGHGEQEAAQCEGGQQGGGDVEEWQFRGSGFEIWSAVAGGSSVK